MYACKELTYVIKPHWKALLSLAGTLVVAGDHFDGVVVHG
jgi:hypothetical protein